MCKSEDTGWEANTPVQERASLCAELSFKDNEASDIPFTKL